ncbi:MAG: PadR family transcriptional regulator [Saprospiraceae bacterium]|jgi:PadR family transcriptional regulator PadR|nr:PadR family transcriptional regulator [Saprospiraceae bacterium]MBP9208999.1 PadR family transcriptional regulator [Saprospiraceae bacterium]
MINTDNAIAQMKKGVLELCILSIIERGEAYPSDIIRQLRDSDLIVVEGTLYPILNRLRSNGYLEYRWRESTSGPPRKYFAITEPGRVALETLRRNWSQFVSSVNQSILNQTANE